jgi:hypothetical protein
MSNPPGQAPVEVFDDAPAKWIQNGAEECKSAEASRNIKQTNSAVDIVPFVAPPQKVNTV